jgi:predicted glycosyltransferase involved in capsule biosynthesis
VENHDTKEEYEDCEIQKSHMQSTKDEEHMEDPTINTILIFHLQMINKFTNNNCRSEGFGCRDLKMIYHGYQN